MNPLLHDARAWIEGRVEATIHSLRHTYAVHMARAGMPFVELKRRLGHKQIKTTMRYADYVPQTSEHVEKGLARMGLSDKTLTVAPTDGREEAEDAGS